MDPTGGFTKSQKTAHGTVYFYEGDAAGHAITASMIRLELAKVSQRQQLIDAIKTPTLSGGQTAAVAASAVAEIINLIVGTVSAAAAVSSAASSATLGVVGLAMQAPNLKSDTLKIGVTNKTQGPVVTQQCQAQSSSTVSVPGPIEPGQSSMAAVIGENGGPMTKGSSVVQLVFRAGSNVASSSRDAAKELVDSSVTVDFRMRFSNDGHWRPAISIDNSDLYKADSTEPAFAAFFQPVEPNMSGFTVASMGLESSTGEGYLCFLPGSDVQYS